MPFCIDSYDSNRTNQFFEEFSNYKNKRKEKNSDSLRRKKQLSQRMCKYKKVPLSASRRKGSLTVEAAVVIPLFLFTMMVLIYLLEIMAIETNIRAGMQYAGKKYAENTYVTPLTGTKVLEKDVIEAVGPERLNRSIIENGASGLDCSNSYVDPLNKILYLKIKYIVKIPVPKFVVPGIEKTESIRIKGWNGYESSLPVSEEQKIVYVTEHGVVYHKDYHCKYLDLSIHMVSAAELETLRNESGGKYYPCERCGQKPQGWGVYITNTGNRYHTSISCSGLKRKIYAVPISETTGKEACSKCGR
nr:pilus assembly protein [uncultured Sellimonas sp.]